MAKVLAQKGSFEGAFAVAESSPAPRRTLWRRRGSIQVQRRPQDSDGEVGQVRGVVV
jgi:hypothetical protein